MKTWFVMFEGYDGLDNYGILSGALPDVIRDARAYGTKDGRRIIAVRKAGRCGRCACVLCPQCRSHAVPGMLHVNSCQERICRRSDGTFGPLLCIDPLTMN